MMSLKALHKAQVGESNGVIWLLVYWFISLTLIVVGKTLEGNHNTCKSSWCEFESFGGVYNNLYVIRMGSQISYHINPKHNLLIYGGREEPLKL